MNEYLVLGMKVVGWLVAIVLAFGSLKVDLAVLQNQVDNLEKKIDRIERLLDRGQY